MKYVMIEITGLRVPVIFPSHLVHAHVAQAMSALLEAQYPGEVARAVSAGDIAVGVASIGGASDSLGVTSLPEDSDIINTIDYLHGIGFGAASPPAQAPPRAEALRDSRGRPIGAGDRIVWREGGGERTGTVETDPAWNGGLRVDGRSLKNIWEAGDGLEVVRAG